MGFSFHSFHNGRHDCIEHPDGNGNDDDAPMMISLPFKILLFILVDGWNLIIGSLVRSFHK